MTPPDPFDKSASTFPVKDSFTYLAHCGISPLYAGAARRLCKLAEAQMTRGSLIFSEYDPVLLELREAAASLMKTSGENLALVKNTSEGMSMVAGGYPFAPGDQMISYVHEYPANHYPWKLQERRGAELVLLPDRDILSRGSTDLPQGWTFDDLESAVTDRTRIIAVSHSQFTSGFTQDLEALGRFCRERAVDLVVDAAQSLGCLPVYPEEFGIQAVVSSGWKWLMGPAGTGLLYTSPKFRAKLDPVMVGAEFMVQGSDYLNHAWQPQPTGKRFEYSTSPMTLAAALATCIGEVHNRYGPEAIQEEIFRLQTLFLDHLDQDRFTPLVFPRKNRGGILAVICPGDPLPVVRALARKGVLCSSRAGYLRIAPHFCNTDEEIVRAAELLNSLETA